MSIVTSGRPAGELGGTTDARPVPDVDVLIIGAGASGAVAAKRLGEAVRTDLVRSHVKMHVDDLDHVAPEDREMLLGHRLHRALRQTSISA